MNLRTASLAVNDPRFEFSLEIGIHLQELQPKHLCLEGDRMGAVETGVQSLVNDRVRGHCLLLAHGRFNERLPDSGRSCASARHFLGGAGRIRTRDTRVKSPLL